MNIDKNPDEIYEDYMVAFIDILGFSSRVRDSIANPESFSKIDYALEAFSKLRLKTTWKENNILIEVEEDAQRRTLNDYYIDNMARCFCFSDSVIIAVKADEHVEERCSALVAILAKIGADLLARGVLIRGAISIGKMYVDQNQQSVKAFGPALIDAYKLEEEQANYPRIVLAKTLVDQLAYPIRKMEQRQPYHQYISRFDDGLAGFSQLTFLEVMQSSKAILPQKKFMELFDQIKNVIIAGLDENMNSTRVFAKYDWLKNAFNHLAIKNDQDWKDKLSRQIRDVQTLDSKHNIHYSFINEGK